MANMVEPYTFQKVTNIKEHNDIVNKLNETIDVVNALDIGGRIFTALTVALDPANWENGNQYVSVDGMTETATVWVSSAINTSQAYTNAGIQCVNQGIDFLQFTCLTTPTATLYVTVVFSEI